jgi:flagellar hook-basal body complex protein FliE
MPIAPIMPIAPVRFAESVSSVAANSSSGGSFADVLGRALDTVSDSHAKADNLAVQAATGDLAAIHDFTIASTEAQILTQLTVEVRNRAVEAFNDIMRMQI